MTSPPSNCANGYIFTGISVGCLSAECAQQATTPTIAISTTTIITTTTVAIKFIGLKDLKKSFNADHHICPKFSSYSNCTSVRTCNFNTDCSTGSACCKGSNGCYSCTSKLIIFLYMPN